MGARPQHYSAVVPVRDIKQKDPCFVVAVNVEVDDTTSLCSLQSINIQTLQVNMNEDD
jgi:hypothetical protein